MKYERTTRNSLGQFLRSRETFRFISHGVKRVYMTVGLPPNDVRVPIGWELDQPRGVTRFTNREAFDRLRGNGGALDVYPNR